jgi:predicted TIM-barrel fold metal-dependent hydrolase
MHRCTIFATIVLGLFCCAALRADDADDIKELKLKDWHPQSMMVTKVTKVDKPAFPVIDQHNHLGNVDPNSRRGLTPEKVKHYLEEMDAAGVRTVVDLDGMWGETLKGTLALLDNAHPSRFLTYAQINDEGLDDEDWSAREAKRLEESFKMGAKGLKFHKSLGLEWKFKNGKYMMPDDPKMDPIYAVCAKYHRPIMIHTGDPVAFFTPLNKDNERWHELNEHPDWLWYGQDYPKLDDLLHAFIHAVEKNPKTIFIGAHFCNYAENVAQVAEWLDKYPNLYIDIDARISELGRQPYTARKFLIKYQDRVMFGTDTTPNDREAYRIYYRFLETDDEYFDCQKSHHLQGFWMIYGVFLPKEVLEKIYCKNAERLLYFGDKNSPLSLGEGPGVRAGASQESENSSDTTVSTNVAGEKKKLRRLIRATN